MLTNVLVPLDGTGDATAACRSRAHSPPPLAPVSVSCALCGGTRTHSRRMRRTYTTLRE